MEQKREVERGFGGTQEVKIVTVGAEIKAVGHNVNGNRNASCEGGLQVSSFLLEQTFQRSSYFTLIKQQAQHPLNVNFLPQLVYRTIPL